jgi:hypothetical protein
MLIASKAMPRAFKSALARSHQGHQVVEYTVTDVIGMKNVPARPGIPGAGRPEPQQERGQTRKVRT